MKDNINTAIAERDRCWAHIREYRDALVEIVSGSRETKTFDFILFFQCITLVLADIALYEKDFPVIDDEAKKLLFDETPAGVLSRVIKEVDYWSAIDDKTSSDEDKLVAIEDLRKSVWGNISCRKNELVELMKAYPKIEDVVGFTLLMQCVSVVILELDLKEKELKILGMDDLPEK